MTLALVPREPTDAMVLEAELRMPQLGRLQIRMLYEIMVAAAPDSQMIMMDEQSQITKQEA